MVKIEPLVTTLSADSRRAKGMSGGGEGRAVFEGRGTQGEVIGRLSVEPKFAVGIVANLLKLPEGTGVILRQVKRYWATLRGRWRSRTIR